MKQIIFRFSIPFVLFALVVGLPYLTAQMLNSHTNAGILGILVMWGLVSMVVLNFIFKNNIHEGK